MKRIVLVIVLVISMMFTTACGGKKDEPVDTSAKEEETQEETKEETKDEEKESEEAPAEAAENVVPETEKTEWGNDDYGYITLSSDWHKFITSDVSAEQNANMLQWQSSDMRKIVTISSGDNTPEGILMSVASSEEEGTYGMDVYGEEDDDYRIGYFGKKYADEDLWLVIYTMATDYSDRTYYFAFEGTGYKDEEEFLEEAQRIFTSHSEFKKTSLYRGAYGDNSTTSNENSGKIDASNYKPGDKYPLYDFLTKELITEVTIPEGFTVDAEYCEDDLLVLDKDGSYESIWIEGFTDYEVEDYLKLGHLNEAVYGKYSDVSAEMVEEYTLSNGFKVYALEIKYHDKEYDLDIHRYNVSILKSDEIGVSFELSQLELEDLGFKSIKEVIDLLFPN